MRKTQFKVGDKVVHASDGVGEITAIIKKTIAGSETELFDITILANGMKVLIPVSQVEGGAVRKVVDKKSIDEVYTILRNRNFVIDRQTWNRRHREYSQKINTGSLHEIAEVMRDLAVLSEEKELSHGEKQMLERAEARLAAEIAVAKNRSISKIIDELRGFFPGMVTLEIRDSEAA